MFSRNALFFYIVLLSLATFYLSRFPGHNGDMPFYIALVIEKEQGSAEGVIERTKEVLRQELPSGEYQDHADRIGNVRSCDIRKVQDQTFICIACFSISQTGIFIYPCNTRPFAAMLFSYRTQHLADCYKKMDPVKTFLVSMTCMLIFPTLLLARLSTPDALSCFILLNVLFFIYFGRNKSLWFSLFLLAICVRLDNVVPELIILFALWQLARRKISKQVVHKTIYYHVMRPFRDGDAR